VLALTVPYRLRVQLNEARARIERGVRQAVFGGRPSWERRANVLPWFDRPDALDRVRGGEDTALLEKWVRDGYFVVDDCVDPADIDEMLATLDGLWDAREPIPDLELLDLRESIDAAPRNVLHRDLVALDVDQRRRMRESSDWRIHGFHYVNAAARRIYANRRLGELASRLFGRRARPIAAINFMTGSEQALHQDMAVFHIWPCNFLIGAWIACEDVAEGSGPLVLYPGSHRAPFFPGFTRYPQTNLRTADRETFRRYQDYVDDLATRFERREFRATKGQVLFWHGMLIHGGAPIARRGTSRRSMVLHYSVRGADRGREVHGPFNW
jgi:ectoine hydroxylase-related dioxygenase (phytanoyl-CoA dioxygenase family)